MNTKINLWSANNALDAPCIYQKLPPPPYNQDIKCYGRQNLNPAPQRGLFGLMLFNQPIQTENKLESQAVFYSLKLEKLTDGRVTQNEECEQKSST